jgi:hypothetical protein
LELQVTVEAISIFLSYSRKDRDLLDVFNTHLAGLVNTGQIVVWHDRDIEAGSEWEPAIQHQLNTANIIILLISANFIASKYCYSNELKRAIERHDIGEAQVIPVILKPCLWNLPKIPFSKLNVLPNNALPVTKWDDLEEAFTLVVEHIAKIVDRLEKNRLRKKSDMLKQEDTERLRQLNFVKQQQKMDTQQNILSELQDAEQQNQFKLVKEYQKEIVILASEKGISYAKLRDLLVAKQWIEADKETFKCMCKAMNRQNEKWLRIEDIKKIPCVDLQVIDTLWVNYSDGKYGFSVQEEFLSRERMQTLERQFRLVSMEGNHADYPVVPKNIACALAKRLAECSCYSS